MTNNPYPTIDDGLRATILALFAADERIASAGLHVGVLNGIVHLAGSMPSRSLRLAAGELAKCVPGVRGVVNRIEAPGAPSPSRIVNLSPKNIKETTE